MNGFDPKCYSAAVQALLVVPRLNRLDAGQTNRAAEPLLKALDDRLLEPHAVHDANLAAACRAGLWLYHDFLDEAHAISEDIETAEGSYWHALMHRRELDFSNSKYWFRRVGVHPIFGELAKDAAELSYLNMGMRWDPFAFVDSCEQFHGSGSPEEETCRRVQRAEWELLFDYCYRRAIGT